MDPRIATEISEEIEEIDWLLARLQSGDAPGTLEIDQALERGFARLMALKAQARDLRGAKSKRAPSTDRALAQIDDCIAQLTGSLTELRVRVSPDSEARIGYGFVLPNRRSRPG